MGGVAIRRLRLRGAPEAAARTAFLVEDACRTEIADSERLILVRRMHIDARMTAGHHDARVAAMRHAWNRATAAACHGGSDGAGAANCVWFAGPEEARRLLLTLLLRGQRPEGWFWRLAVPDWEERDWPAWALATLAAPAPAEGPHPVIAMLNTIIAEGQASALVRSLLPGDPSASRAADGVSRSAPVAEGAVTALAEEDDATVRASLRLAAGIAINMPLALRRLVQASASGPGAAPALAQRLAEAIILQAAPATILSRAVLIRTTRLLLAQVLAGDFAHAPRSAGAEPAGRRRSSVHFDTPPPPAAYDQSVAPDVRIVEREPAILAPGGAAPFVREAHPAPPADDFLPPLATERVSNAAGLWLVLPSLIHMGFREWIAAHPALLPQDPGRTLLRLIACHHRVAWTDPALTALIGQIDRPDASCPAWAMLWRKGLDGWLRRRARVTLAGLVWRRGWLSGDSGRLIVRFRADAADLRLRRRALDVDPGWTDWIGLSVRYRYTDEPLR